MSPHLVRCVVTLLLAAGCDSREPLVGRSAPRSPSDPRTFERPLTGDETRQLAADPGVANRWYVTSAAADGFPIDAISRAPLTLLRYDGPADDRVLAAIAGSATLQHINLTDYRGGAMGLKRLLEMPSLTGLRLVVASGDPPFQVPEDSSEVKSHAPSDVSRGAHLKSLHLIGWTVDAEAVAVIERMTKLQSLYIDGGVLNAEALQSLLERRPRLHCHVDSLHLD